MTTTPSAARLREDMRTTGLVTLAHGTSHFFQLLLPPLFPLLVAEFGFSYSELGLLLSLFFVTSGIGQALAGFVVDKLGARPVLFGSLGLFAAAAVVAASSTGYGGFVLVMVLSGLGNAPFHPADFTILNRRVSSERLGHAYAAHGISGNLGWAASPILAVIAAASSSWRIACLSAAVWVVVVIMLLFWQRDALAEQAPKAKNTVESAAAPQEHPLAFLKLPAVWLCFAFFFWTTCALAAIQSFAAPALERLYQMPLTLAASVVTGFMLCSAVGMILGGFIVGRIRRMELTIGVCLMASALLMVVVGLALTSGIVGLVIAALSGFGIGIAGPSRDMLIKTATPPGATGRVYGMVYSGLDLGSSVAAPVWGAMMDGHWYSGIFYGSAVALAISVAAAAFVGANVAARRLAPTTAPA
ncbi:MAG: MFS transporter [Comamonas sp. SCN 65-56]|uniref:MFS transporter n=1 Tax=Comamonas sp. SCN 65-56 TaxID=1660095 RepID=UPI00086E258D|nr:MFS transporter [Comamonas sp. SCN 65-56]ODS93109.1 MAG: MFS transporter [Comamonas sp. SCN 65-56]